MIICPECQQNFESYSAFNGHPYKAHKITIENFCKKYWPKNDLFTKEQLPFKNLETYLNSDFTNKNNLKKYCGTISNEECQELFLKILLKTKHKLNSENNYNFAPTQTYLRSIIAPAIPTIEKTLGRSYEQILLDVGFDKLYNYNYKNIQLNNKNDEIIILIDTREQKKLILPYKTIITKLDSGDYSIQSPYYDNLYIERKSITDFCSTLSMGFERFQREIDRAKQLNHYIVVLVEESFSSISSLEHLPHTKNIKAKPEFVFHRMREIIRKNNNIQFLFVSGRKECSGILVKLLTNPVLKSYDLQYLYDLKQL